MFWGLGRVEGMEGKGLIRPDTEGKQTVLFHACLCWPKTSILLLFFLSKQLSLKKNDHYLLSHFFFHFSIFDLLELIKLQLPPT